MRYFDVSYNTATLSGTIHGTVDPRIIFIHGSSASGSLRSDMLRQHLAKVGIASASFDFVGHGQTGGDASGSSLEDRLRQAKKVIDAIHLQRPLIIVGVSMGADTAIRLTQYYPTSALILIVPAFYGEAAYAAPFGSDFSNVIQQGKNWKQSDTWELLREYSGSLLAIGAEKDEEIASEIYDTLDEFTTRVNYKELYIVPRAPHSVLPYLSEHMDEFARVFKRVYHVIVSSVAQERVAK